jgi:DNA-binding NtrC family response regulator
MAHILVIDDDAAVRGSVRRLLERAGHTVFEAADGAAGIRLLSAESVALVLTDIYMPGQDGFATLRRLRREWPKVKVITMSGGTRAGPADLNADAAAMGAARTLSKPFDPEDLIDAVRSVLGEQAGPGKT